MFRTAAVFMFGLVALPVASAQSAFLFTTSDDYQVTNVFSDVDTFNILVELDEPLAPGVYNNPDIVSVTYQVVGTLQPGTPSGFPAFDLQRQITGDEFYAQGSSLSFEIAPTAVLDDGVQAAELVGNGAILRFNAREIDNGRFHPALFELNADGTGRIQNSNNVPSLNPLVEVDFGGEYITDLVFDPGNTTLISDQPVLGDDVGPGDGDSSTLAFSPLLLALIAFARRFRIRWRNGVTACR